MILPDANLLLYAYDRTSPFQARAAAWWKECMEGDDPVGIAPVTAFAFVRIATNPRVFSSPMSAQEAIEHITQWLDVPIVRFVEAVYPARVFDLVKEIGTAGNLVSDAQLAAIALEEGGIVHTADHDFRRFKGLRCVYPLDS
jgi:uncharacterized protein